MIKLHLKIVFKYKKMNTSKYSIFRVKFKKKMNEVLKSIFTLTLIIYFFYLLILPDYCKNERNTYFINIYFLM